MDTFLKRKTDSLSKANRYTLTICDKAIAHPLHTFAGRNRVSDSKESLKTKEKERTTKVVYKDY